ncbi:response regulator transcription factor [Burkholderia thailandensis]|nr:response regulator transcription factor [Burkholderia thailandensis]MCS6485611.1 response regulator transcription factor [Burkholderia thailandensis]PJO72452.1 DNA-binding response regulator [Burkholderia thailandensis]TBW57761.1 response regulator transcription factor [Burkholderia thailandensis]
MGQLTKIAVMDYDPVLTDYLCRLLSTGEQACRAFSTGRALLEGLKHETFDLVVLAREISDRSGGDFLRRIRRGAAAPLPVMLVGYGDSESGIGALLNAGAADFIARPVSPAMLRARVDALLSGDCDAGEAAAVRRFDRFEFSSLSRRVRFGRRTVALTQTEFDLAMLLFRHCNRPLSQACIAGAVRRRDEADLPPHVLATHVAALRAKLELRPGNGYRLTPIYGYGYRLERIAGRLMTTTSVAPIPRPAAGAAFA